MMLSNLHVRKKTNNTFLLLFGENLKKIRTNKRITQAQLAIDCDFDVSVISRIERGIVNTSLSNIKIIADSLDIPINELFKFDS